MSQQNTAKDTTVSAQQETAADSAVVPGVAAFNKAKLPTGEHKQVAINKDQANILEQLESGSDTISLKEPYFSQITNPNQADLELHIAVDPRSAEILNEIGVMATSDADKHALNFRLETLAERVTERNFDQELTQRLAITKRDAMRSRITSELEPATGPEADKVVPKLAALATLKEVGIDLEAKDINNMRLDRAHQGTIQFRNYLVERLSSKLKNEAEQTGKDVDKNQPRSDAEYKKLALNMITESGGLNDQCRARWGTDLQGVAKSFALNKPEMLLSSGEARDLAKGFSSKDPKKKQEAQLYRRLTGTVSRDYSDTHTNRELLSFKHQAKAEIGQYQAEAQKTWGTDLRGLTKVHLKYSQDKFLSETDCENILETHRDKATGALTVEGKKHARLLSGLPNFNYKKPPAPSQVPEYFKEVMAVAEHKSFAKVQPVAAATEDSAGFMESMVKNAAAPIADAQQIAGAQITGLDANSPHLERLLGAKPENGVVTAGDLAQGLYKMGKDIDGEWGKPDQDNVNAFMAGLNLLSSQDVEIVDKAMRMLPENEDKVSFKEFVANIDFDRDRLAASANQRLQGFNPAVHALEIKEAVDRGGERQDHAVFGEMAEGDIRTVERALVGLNSVQLLAVQQAYLNSFEGKLPVEVSKAFSSEEIKPVVSHHIYHIDADASGDVIHNAIGKFQGWNPFGDHLFDKDDEGQIRNVLENRNMPKGFIKFIEERYQYGTNGPKEGRDKSLRKHLEDNLSGDDLQRALTRINRDAISNEDGR